MYCKHCGNQITPNANFCTRCGQPVENSSTGTTLKESLTNEDYLKAYIGNNYEKIIKRNGSLWTFLFGYSYLLYRKMWASALLLMLFYILLYNNLEANLAYLCHQLVSLILTFSFKTLYVQRSQKKIEQIKVRNSEKTNEEILEICKKKGGTSIGLIFLPFIITITLAFLNGFLAALI